MNWDQIETKWAAMTRRVRPDWSEGPMFSAAVGLLPKSDGDQRFNLTDVSALAAEQNAAQSVETLPIRSE